MAVNKYGDISVKAGVHAEVAMLEHAEPFVVLGKFADPKPLPKNSSETIRFKRMIPFAPATTALTEGVTPTSVDMRYETIDATVDQYGNVSELTDVIDDLHEHEVGADMGRLMAENAAETIEKVTWGQLQAGTNVMYANGADTDEVNEGLTLALQRKATRGLRANKAKKITSILGPSAMISTKPVEAAYVALTHTDMEAEIRNMPGFVPVAEYGSRQPLCNEEIGSVEDVRYICSPDLEPNVDAGAAPGTGATKKLSTSGSACDIYPVLLIGQHSYGAIALKGSKAAGGAIKPIVRNPGTPDSNDPLGQVGSVGWKTYFKSVILNDAWMCRLEVAVNETPVTA